MVVERLLDGLPAKDQYLVSLLSIEEMTFDKMVSEEVNRGEAMTDEEREREADEEAKRLIIAAWTTEPRPGQRERVLAAISAAAEKRAQEAEAAKGGTEPVVA